MKEEDKIWLAICFLMKEKGMKFCEICEEWVIEEHDHSNY